MAGGSGLLPPKASSSRHLEYAAAARAAMRDPPTRGLLSKNQNLRRSLLARAGGELSSGSQLRAGRRREQGARSGGSRAASDRATATLARQLPAVQVVKYNANNQRHSHQLRWGSEPGTVPARGGGSNRGFIVAVKAMKQHDCH